MTYQVWHLFVNNLGVKIDVLKLTKELGIKNTHATIQRINDNYMLDIRRCGYGVYVLDEIYE